MTEQNTVAVVSSRQSTAAPILRKLLACQVDELNVDELLRERRSRRNYQAVVLENPEFSPQEEGLTELEETLRDTSEGFPLTVVSLDEPAGRLLASRLGDRAFRYSDGKNWADLTAKNVNLRWGKLEFEALTDDDIVRIRLECGENPDLYGALAALACVLGLGMSLLEAAERLNEPGEAFRGYP